MNIAVIGSGYVGLVVGTCLAEIGHRVTCIDKDNEKIASLREGVIPLFEPGLEELVRRNVKSERLHFVADYHFVSAAQVIFLAVGTPSGEDGGADLTYLEEAAKSLAPFLTEGAVVAIKSTVPVGTGHNLEKMIGEHTSKTFHLVNNPEFLREGSAVKDFMHPDRIVIGCRQEWAGEIMEELYSPLVRQGNPLYKMSNISAEMSKYAANCFLATKISFVNEMANFCEHIGADIDEVRRVLGSDKRIGNTYLYPGPGYGGSCFPKDVRELLYSAGEREIPLSIVRAADEVNRRQKALMLNKISHHFGGNLKGKKIAFWGTAFKANTDDVRESVAIDLALGLVGEGGEICFYDPEAGANFAKTMEKFPHCRDKIHRGDSSYSCLDGCDALVVITEWREFQRPDFEQIKKRLSTPVIFDLRNLFGPERAKAFGLVWNGIGKPGL